MGAAIGADMIGDETVTPAHGSQHCTCCGQQGMAAGAGWRLPNKPPRKPPQVLLWKQPVVPAVISASAVKINSLRIVLSPGRKVR